MSLTTLALLFLAGLAGGFIDAIAGGGGLITLPALLAAGLPPQIALGTNKFQSSCGTILAVIRYARAGMMKTPWLWLAVACSFFASMAGTHVLTIISNDTLKKLIPWMLAAVA
ncbi:MAG: TSUP family transporter, partial [Verrucomicrobia bacterium]|nr:TSUP family transporter [Verrucomicrobiota bacterium]